MKNHALLGLSILLAGCSTVPRPDVTVEVHNESSFSSSCGSKENPCPMPRYTKIAMFQDNNGNWLKISDDQLFISADKTEWKEVSDGIWETPEYHDPDGRTVGSSRLRITNEGLFSETYRDGEQAWEKILAVWWVSLEGTRTGISPTHAVWETDGTISDFPDEEGTFDGIKVTD